MSNYRIVWPDDVADQDSEQEPVILQYRIDGAHAPAAKMDIITRARHLFANRSCHSCGYPVVVPLELNDSQLNRNHLPIPGTATLVGFRCCGCHAEWSV